VHLLLSDQISEMGLDEFYNVQNNYIEGENGTRFSFEGLRHNVKGLKSYEGVDICWIEEAQTVSKASWSILIPTIRKAGSEIWITFNPELPDDETYKRFVLNTPPDAIKIKMGWQDNPWFPPVLEAERLYLKEQDPDAYLNVWEGECIEVLEGAIYAKELRKAREEERLTRVPYDATKPVQTIWDLGFADSTAIWFAQVVGMELRFIDYYENSREPLTHYINVLNQRGYVYGMDYLPHDAQAKQLGTGRSIEELMRELGRKVQIVPKLSIADGINAARTMFGMAWFDEAKCSDGLQALRHYRYERDEDRNVYRKEPLHDWASHGADAFRYCALVLKRQEAAKPLRYDLRGYA
jgi:phage terminase large subunit